MSDLPRDLRVKAGMIMMCERIPFGSDAALMEMAANEIEQLQQRNAELEEQVEQCKFHINCLHETIEHLNQYWNRDCNEQAMRDFCFEVVERTDMAMEITPAQHLAEHDREVAARAVKHGFERGFQRSSNYANGENTEYMTVVKLAEEYANKIKSGEVSL